MITPVLQRTRVRLWKLGELAVSFAAGSGTSSDAVDHIKNEAQQKP